MLSVGLAHTDTSSSSSPVAEAAAAETAAETAAAAEGWSFSVSGTGAGGLRSGPPSAVPYVAALNSPAVGRRDGRATEGEEGTTALSADRDSNHGVVSRPRRQLALYTEPHRTPSAPVNSQRPLYTGERAHAGHGSTEGEEQQLLMDTPLRPHPAHATDAWRRQLAPGSRMIACSQRNWYEAKVVAAEGDKLSIHYQGWSKRWDEIVDRFSNGIQPLSSTEQEDMKVMQAPQRLTSRQSDPAPQRPGSTPPPAVECGSALLKAVTRYGVTMHRQAETQRAAREELRITRYGRQEPSADGPALMEVHDLSPVLISAAAISAKTKACKRSFEHTGAEASARAKRQRATMLTATESKAMCSICQRDVAGLDPETPLCKLFCGHVFCKTCIGEWFSRGRNSCPNCCKHYGSLRNATFTTVKALCGASTVASVDTSPTACLPSCSECKVCHQSDQCELMVSCAGCGSNYHSGCVMLPPSATVSFRNWYCSDEECRLKAAAQRIRRQYAGQSSRRATGVTVPKGKTLLLLQAACIEAGLWTGGYTTDLCMRLARHELGLPQRTLDYVRQTFRMKTCIKMLFSDGVWYKGWVLSEPDNSGCIDILFDDGEVEHRVPTLAGSTFNDEVQSLETDLDAVVYDVLDSLVHTIEEASVTTVAPLANAAASLHSDRGNDTDEEQQAQPRTSRFRGVRWDRAGRCWKAAIGTHGQTRHLGCFRGDGAEEEAARAYDRAARELHGSKAQPNFASVLEQQAQPRTSRFRGVSWNRAYRCWIAQIGAHGQTRHLGSFRGNGAEEQAARAYDRAARELHGDKAQLNFPSTCSGEADDAKHIALKITKKRKLSQTKKPQKQPYEKRFLRTTKQHTRLREDCPAGPLQQEKVAGSRVGIQYQAFLPLLLSPTSVSIAEHLDENQRAGSTELLRATAEDSVAEWRGSTMEERFVQAVEAHGKDFARVSKMMNAAACVPTCGSALESLKTVTVEQVAAFYYGYWRSSLAQKLWKRRRYRKKAVSQTSHVDISFDWQPPCRDSDGRLTLSTASFHTITSAEASRGDTCVPPATESRGPREQPGQPRTSRFHGVSWVRAKRCWRADITTHEQTRHLGCFRGDGAEEEAARAYDRAARELHGDQAQLNYSSVSGPQRSAVHATPVQCRDAAQLFLSQVRRRFGCQPKKLLEANQLLINRCNLAASAYHQGNLHFHDLLKDIRKQARELFGGHPDLKDAFETTFVARDECEWTIRTVITSMIQEVEHQQNTTGCESVHGECAEEQAASAYDRAARELHGSNAQLNFASVSGPQRSDAVSQTKPDEARKAVTAVVRGLVRSVVARAQPSQPRTSRFRGVSWNCARGCWKAQIRTHGQTRYLGYFRGDGAEEQAARAYDRAARELHGSKAQPNFASVSGPQRSDAVSQTNTNQQERKSAPVASTSQINNTTYDYGFAKTCRGCAGKRKAHTCGKARPYRRKVIITLTEDSAAGLIFQQHSESPTKMLLQGVEPNSQAVQHSQLVKIAKIGSFVLNSVNKTIVTDYESGLDLLQRTPVPLNLEFVDERKPSVSTFAVANAAEQRDTKPDEACKAVTAVVRGLVRSVVARAQPGQPRTSRFRGVSWDRAYRCWKAQIGAHGQSRSLGRFRGDEAEEQAARAYDRAARELHGDKAQLNFASVSEPRRSDAVSQTNTDEMHKVGTVARTENSKRQAVPIEQSSSHHPANQSNVRQVRAVQGSTTNLPRPVGKQPHPSSVGVDGACCCAMSRCLKLYCPCFRDGRPCGPQCKCCGCKNDLDREANCEWIAAEAHRQTQLSKKRKTDGCNCKASRCLKKYCVCFRAGRQCDSSCQCISCANCSTTEGGC
jgi:hypothetical protein